MNGGVFMVGDLNHPLEGNRAHLPPSGRIQSTPLGSSMHAFDLSTPLARGPYTAQFGGSVFSRFRACLRRSKSQADVPSGASAAPDLIRDSTHPSLSERDIQRFAVAERRSGEKHAWFLLMTFRKHLQHTTRFVRSCIVGSAIHAWS